MYNDPFILSVLKVVFTELLNVKGKVPFSKYFDVSGGYAFKSSQYSESGIFVLRVTNIEPDGSINSHDQKFIPTERIDASLTKFALSKNDVLMVMVGGSIGKVGVVSEENLPALLNQNLWKIENAESLNCRYVYYLCLYLKEFVAPRASSTHGHFSRNEFRNLTIPSLSKSETDQVANFLDRIVFTDIVGELSMLDRQLITLRKMVSANKYSTSLEDENRKQQSYLQLLSQTILKEAVQGKLTKQDAADEHASELLKRIKAEKQKLIKEGKLKKEKELPPITEDEIPFELPKGWVWCRLGEVINDLKYGTSQKCDYTKAQHAVLRIPNLSKGVIDFEDLKFATLPEAEFKNLKLEFDDMLVIRSNGSENLVGRSAIFKGAEFDCAYAGYLMRLRFHKKLLSIDYLHQVLESRFIRNLIEFPLRTTSGVKNINSTEVSNLLIPLPPLPEQQRIVTKVQKLQQQLAALETQVQQSRQYANQLLQAVLKEAFAVNQKEYATNEQLTMAAEE